MQKHLMVAGCSYSAPSQSLPGTSWSEVLAERLGWRLTNLARQGCSNGGIRIQIEEIRRQRPDFAIVTPTFWDRMEIPAHGANYEWNQKKNSNTQNALQDHLQNRAIGNGYDRQAGIRNVNYGTEPSNMICETIFTLAQNGSHPYRMGSIPRETQQAVKHYIDQMYDSNWKKQQDEWIIAEGVLQMYFDGLAFFVQPVLLWPWDPNNAKLWRQAFPSVLPDLYIMLHEPESVLPLTGNNTFVGEDPGYHGSPRSQELIAENWYRRITQDHGIQ
jgi:hypothetical protein